MPILFNYGFANCKVYKDELMPEIDKLGIKNSLKPEIKIAYKNEFSYLSVNGENFENIEKELQLPDYINAPIEAGTKVGKLIYKIGDKQLGEVDIITKERLIKLLLKIFIKKFGICGQYKGK